jgi:hypothetical protein
MLLVHESIDPVEDRRLIHVWECKPEEA